jgi:hypothetical protein
MADEILYAGLADQRTTEVLNGDYIMLATDRNALPNHPALFYGGNLAGSGSTTTKVAHAGIMGYDLPAVIADGAEVPNTAWTDGSTTVTVARRSKSYSASSIARFTDSLGLLSSGTLAQDAFASHALDLTNTIANLVDGFSNTVGASGSDLTVANVLAGLTLLEVGYESGIAEGACMGVLHTVQMGDLRDDLATVTGGALQWSVPPEQLRLRGSGFRGRYLGVDWFASGYVPTANAGADRAGGIFVRGAIVWADMSVAADTSDQLAIGGKILFERDRAARSDTTAYVSHSYHGASEGLDAFGVSIITDA